MSVLANEEFQHQTLKSYLSVLCYAQIARGLPNLFADASFPRLEYVLNVVKKMRAEEGRSHTKPCLPIILVILKCLWSVWSVGTPSSKNDHVMLGGMLLRVLWLLEGGRVHSTPIRKGF